MRRLALGLLGLTLLAGTAGVLAWRHYAQFLARPVFEAEQVVVIPKGTSYAGIVRLLTASQASSDAPIPWTWRVLGRLHPQSGRLRAGEFRVTAETTPQELLDLLASGEVVQHAFTIVEGWRFSEVLAALAADGVLEPTLKELPPAEVARRVDPDLLHPEGWFAPETYYFPRGERDIDLLKRAYEAQQAALAQAWATRVDALPLSTPEELLTLASIVEKETGQAQERARIAGVFVRRLNLKMRLQTDPTVIYGLGEAFDGDLRRRDLRADTPYNTYTRFGLPPTPIAMPGRDALDATARPEPGDSLYFVARGDGTHQFSATLDEHNAAVAKYQLGRSSP